VRYLRERRDDPDKLRRVLVDTSTAAPQVGGVFSAMLLTLFVIPPIYAIWRWQVARKTLQNEGDRG